MKNLATFFYEIQFSFHNKHNNNKKTKFPLPLFLTSKPNNNKKNPKKTHKDLMLILLSIVISSMFDP